MNSIQKAFKANGYCICPQLLTAHDCEQILDTGHALVSHYLARGAVLEKSAGDRVEMGSKT